MAAMHLIADVLEPRPSLPGKSQLMKFAARVSHRSVVASGRGSSGAGLTVSAIKDGSAWVLEAGALVLADGEAA